MELRDKDGQGSGEQEEPTVTLMEFTLLRDKRQTKSGHYTLGMPVACSSGGESTELPGHLSPKTREQNISGGSLRKFSLQELSFSVRILERQETSTAKLGLVGQTEEKYFSQVVEEGTGTLERV